MKLTFSQLITSHEPDKLKHCPAVLNPAPPGRRKKEKGEIGRFEFYLLNQHPSENLGC
jgi:hypothetical protein